MKRHLRPPLLKGQGRSVLVVSPLYGVTDITCDAVM